MKKLLMISTMLLVGVLSVSAQTYCYKYLFNVDENGMKFEDKIFGGSNKYCYYTFTNNKNAFYESDKNGIDINTSLGLSPSTPAVYSKTENGILIYKKKGLSEYYLVSPDYSRINLKYKPILRNRWETAVWERTTEPEKEHAPTQLY